MKKEKYRELISYLIFGVLTTGVGLGSYYLLTISLLDPQDKIELQIANVISWLLAVLFAYFTNKKYVFRSNEKHVLKEGSKFLLSRISTLLLDMLAMFLMVSIFHINDKIAKVISQILVIITNYVISKLFVFVKKEKHL